jgi:hypothetical protein
LAFCWLGGGKYCCIVVVVVLSDARDDEWLLSLSHPVGCAALHTHGASLYLLDIAGGAPDFSFPSSSSLLCCGKEKKKKERWFDNGTSRRKKSSIAD